MGHVSISVLHIEEICYYNLLLLLSNQNIESHCTWSGTLDPICGGKRVYTINFGGKPSILEDRTEGQTVHLFF